MTHTLTDRQYTHAVMAFRVLFLVAVAIGIEVALGHVGLGPWARGYLVAFTMAFFIYSPGWQTTPSNP